MKLTFIVSAMALMALFAVPNFTASAQASDMAYEATQPRINITRIKSVLRLTPEQQAYWPPVEAALRDLSRRRSVEANGMLTRVSAYVMDSRTIARLGAAARPLVHVLDERQKADAIVLVREMGLGPVLTALL